MSSQEVEIEAAHTDHAETNSVPSDVAETMLPEGNPAAPSLAPPPHRQLESNQGDLSAAIRPTPSEKYLNLSDKTLRYPGTSRISESFGLEGCAGIIG